MKIVLAGAFGKLGTDILRELTGRGFEVIAADMVSRDIGGDAGYTVRIIDVTKPETLEGLCDGADVVITTVGLTGASNKFTHYDIDLEGNKNLLSQAKKAGVKKFIYISVLKAETDPSVPMLDAKNKFEAELKKSGIPYLIYRPTGYFYDIAKVFMPMVEKGQVNLLGKKDVHANVIDTSDLARFIAEHMDDSGKTVSIGGTETYSYAEIATMFFEAAGKPPVIKRVPAVLFDVLAAAAKLRKTGKFAVIRFSKWTLSRDMVGETCYGRLSFKEYIKNCYQKER